MGGALPGPDSSYHKELRVAKRKSLAWTQKRRAAPRTASLRALNSPATIKTALVLAVFTASLTPLQSESAEFRLQPSLTVSEEYTDNAYLDPPSPPALPVQSDFITRIAPSIGMTYKAPLWDWDAVYTYDYRRHTEDARRRDPREKTQSGRLNSLIRLVPEFLFLEVTDDFSRVSLNATRDYTQESSFLNQTDRNVFSASPYVTTRVSDRTTLTAGYRYRKTWYENPQSIDTTEQEGYSNLRHEVSLHTTVTGSVRYAQNENSTLPYAKTDVSVGQAYEYAEGSSLTTAIGYSRFHFENDDRTRKVFWDVRERHRFLSITVLFETGITYIPDSTQVLLREDRVVTTVRRDTEQVVLSVSGGIRKYRETVTKTLQTTSHRADCMAGYAFTPNDRISGTLTVERIDEEAQRTFIRRHQYGLRLDHTVSETVTLAADYRYGQAYDPAAYININNYFNNYRSNRFLVEARMSF